MIPCGDHLLPKGRLTEKVNTLGAQREALQKEITELTAKVKELALKLYDPLVKAASYYWDWDEALKQAKQPREAKNIAIFADLYYKAGLLRPEIAENHARMMSPSTSSTAASVTPTSTSSRTTGT